MKNRSFKSRSAWLPAAAWLVLTTPLLAQPTNKRAERAKPQVIYHLPASPNYAATLHSQAKGQNNLEPEASTATPPPVSHENQNVAPPAARQEAAPRFSP